MQITITNKEVESAVECWLRNSLNFSGKMSVIKNGMYSEEFTVEVDMEKPVTNTEEVFGPELKAI